MNQTEKEGIKKNMVFLWPGHKIQIFKIILYNIIIILPSNTYETLFKL